MGAGERVRPGQPGDGKRHPGGGEDRGMIGAVDIRGAQADAGGKVRDRDFGSQIDRLRRGQAGARCGAVPVGQDVHGDQTGRFLEAQDGRDVVARHLCFAGQDEASADVGVAGERQFTAGGKNPDLRVIPGISGRQDEGRFGEIEFPGNGLHVGVAKAARVQHDGQGIAAEPAVREYIDGDEAASHDLLPPPAPSRSFPGREGSGAQGRRVNGRIVREHPRLLREGDISFSPGCAWLGSLGIVSPSNGS